MRPDYGYGGRVLRVDLAGRTTRSEELDEAFARAYLGGNGFAARLVMDSPAVGADPLSAENVLVFAVGPFAGTPIWGSSRGLVAAISPQTGYFADSTFGGDLPDVQKRTGWDAVVISGASEEPVYLLVTAEGAWIKSAAELWGATTFDAVDALRAAEGASAVPAAIGPAGENGVVFASILCAGRRHGTAGRCGLGAVMGAKKLKAVVVRGDLGPRIWDADGLRRFLRERRAALREGTAWLRAEGTSHLVDTVSAVGLLGTHNNQGEVFSQAGRIGAAAMSRDHRPRNVACRGCPVACGKVGSLRAQGTARDAAGGASALVLPDTVKLPEYETLYSLGSMMDNGDLESIVAMNAACDAYGMDTISMGGTLAFVAECMERGLVGAEELAGEIRFGDGNGLRELIEATALGRGAGRRLAVGSRRLAEQLGRGTGRFLYETKGLEMAGHSARGVLSMALGYATSTRGGSHHDTRPNYALTYDRSDLEAQVAFNVESQNWTAAGDALLICRFVGERGFGAEYHTAAAELLHLVTGWDVDAGELERIGERIYNLERLINVRRGMSRADDRLPYRITHEPIPEGPAKGRYCPEAVLEQLLDRYYARRGWDSGGVPTKSRLEGLGIV